jgi:hypothetical protein
LSHLSRNAPFGTLAFKTVLIVDLPTHLSA